MKKVWIFFPEMTLAQFPKLNFSDFGWIFFPKMTLTQFPVFGFFFQDSRIGVKRLNGSFYSNKVRISIDSVKIGKTCPFSVFEWPIDFN